MPNPASSAASAGVLGLPNLIDDVIPSHLFYACRYWSDHLTVVTDGGELLVLLEDFLSHRVLFWAEVMQKSMMDGGLMLSKAYAWIKSLTTGDNLEDVCREAQKCVQLVEAGLPESTPQIYVPVPPMWQTHS
ncbi:hypothetical protein FRC08_011071 [Ceratobasidium sp. 394]|nr:hypothetical protein FRC08_011071 [Ceratobasidium sp. 394]